LGHKEILCAWALIRCNSCVSSLVTNRGGEKKKEKEKGKGIVPALQETSTTLLRKDSVSHLPRLTLFHISLIRVRRSPNGGKEGGREGKGGKRREKSWLTQEKWCVGDWFNERMLHQSSHLLTTSYMTGMKENQGGGRGKREGSLQPSIALEGQPLNYIKCQEKA